MSPFQNSFAKREKGGLGCLLRDKWFHFIAFRSFGRDRADAECGKSAQVFPPRGLREAVHGGRARKGHAVERPVPDALTQLIRLRAAPYSIVKRYIRDTDAAVFQFFGENAAALGRTQQERRAAALHFPAERVREVFAVVSLGHEVGADAAGSEPLFAGQAAKLSPKQKERAFQEVRWGKRPENIPVLEQAGITVDKFGGEAFRAAVSDGEAKLAKLLLEKGADINYHKPDMVFPYASTPVTEAARSNDFPMVRWLVEQGADITIADKYGDRPYTVAVQNKNQELADYLKALEPEDWHNEQEKVRQLMPYKLPAKLVEYLKTGPLRLEFPEQEWVKWAELYAYMDVQEMTWKRKRLLSLMAAMDNYSDYLLLWSPRDKKLWYLDIEHEEFHPLAKWEEFIADPGKYLNGMIEGEFEE